MSRWWRFVPRPLKRLAKAAKRAVEAARQPEGWAEYQRWRARGFASPASPAVKWAVLERYGRPGDTWVETGTYLGDTTAFLARSAGHVYSIEPGPDLARRARARFAGNGRVTIVEGYSEDHLARLLEGIDGPLSLWLDGHYSAGITQRGPVDTPIRIELDLVARHLARLPRVSVLVDDVRCFEPEDPEYGQYPTRSWLVGWAEANGLWWTIEHDIFVALKRP
jgi:hypothetical protein